MYCRQCGKQMNENDIYCSQCGAKNVLNSVAIEEPQNQQQENNADQSTTVSTSQERSGCGCFIAFVVIVLIAIAVIFLIFLIENEQDNSGDKSSSNVINQVTSRDATNRDINIDSKLNVGSLSLDIIILPDSNIDDLEITIKYLDKNHNVLRTDVKRIGNVKAGIQVTKSISLAEFPFSLILKVDSCQIAVSGGTVSYFQR